MIISIATAILSASITHAGFHSKRVPPSGAPHILHHQQRHGDPRDSRDAVEDRIPPRELAPELPLALVGRGVHERQPHEGGIGGACPGQAPEHAGDERQMFPVPVAAEEGGRDGRQHESQADG